MKIFQSIFKYAMFGKNNKVTEIIETFLTADGG